MTEKDKLVNAMAPELAEKTGSARESWRVFGIMSELLRINDVMIHPVSARALLVVLLLAAALPVAAQQSKPPVLEPLPEPPPPPPGYELDPALEPQVTILKRGTDTVEEYRIGGKLYMIKVTPASGAPYYMIDHRGDGTFARQDHFNSGIRPPLWVIHTF